MTVSTGNKGLDRILTGGLPERRLYLLEGAPGSGKTTLAMQFLLDGVSRGERVLYITLSETKEELTAVAASHDWTLEGIDVFEFESAANVFGDGREQSILHSWETELGETVQLIQAEVERVLPKRVVFDSLSEMRLLAQDPLRYRRQVLGLKQFFAGRDSTVILVDDLSGNANGRDGHLHSLCHGVVTLERLTLDFGAARRRLQVQKLRGVDFMAGYHDMAIFEFDERIGTMLTRAKAFGIDLQQHMDDGCLTIRQIDPAELSPAEFAGAVRSEVEDRGCGMIVIDSLNGYLAAMPQEQQLILQMHELLSYLSQQGVATFLINPQSGLVGTMATSLNVSYIADAVLLLRFFEADGRIRKAISVLKNRGGLHEDTIRELRIDAEGVRVGEPLAGFKGVLTGTPKYTGTKAPLMEDRT